MFALCTSTDGLSSPPTHLSRPRTLHLVRLGHAMHPVDSKLKRQTSHIAMAVLDDIPQRLKTQIIF